MKWKQERINHASLCMYTIRDITSSIKEMQFRVADTVLSKKSFFRLLKLCFLRAIHYLSPKAEGDVGRRIIG